AAATESPIPQPKAGRSACSASLPPAIHSSVGLASQAGAATGIACSLQLPALHPLAPSAAYIRSAPHEAAPGPPESGTPAATPAGVSQTIRFGSLIPYCTQHTV